MTDEACTACGGPLDDGRPVQRGLDGSGAHCDCLDSDDPEEGDDHD